MGAVQYRKRPIVVEAIQWTGDNEAEVAAWAGGLQTFHAVPPEDRSDDPDITAEVFDRLHSTWVGVKTGQWIVRGVKDEFYPIAEDVLAETYDPADTPAVDDTDGDPFMPVEVFADQIQQGIEDYCDGDDPGWFSARWNEETRELALDYQPDEDAEPQYRGTTHVFRLGAQARVGGPSLGEVAYAGYKAGTRGVSLVSGVSLPPWGELEPEMQAAWQAAADAARTAS